MAAAGHGHPDADDALARLVLDAAASRRGELLKGKR
jgi:hypothetical protein